MTQKEFFKTVVDMRILQKRRERYCDRDPYTRRECKRLETEIDKEIKRVEIVLRETAQPRFFNLPNDYKE